MVQLCPAHLPDNLSINCFSSIPDESSCSILTQPLPKRMAGLSEAAPTVSWTNDSLDNTQDAGCQYRESLRCGMQAISLHPLINLHSREYSWNQKAHDFLGQAFGLTQKMLLKHPEVALRCLQALPLCLKQAYPIASKPGQSLHTGLQTLGNILTQDLTACSVVRPTKLPSHRCATPHCR